MPPSLPPRHAGLRRKTRGSRGKERTRARIKVMRKAKGGVSKGETREKGRQEAGVMDENIRELALRMKAMLASQEAPTSLY